MSRFIHSVAFFILRVLRLISQSCDATHFVRIELRESRRLQPRRRRWRLDLRLGHHRLRLLDHDASRRIWKARRDRRFATSRRAWSRLARASTMSCACATTSPNQSDFRTVPRRSSGSSWARHDPRRRHHLRPGRAGDEDRDRGHRAASRSQPASTQKRRGARSQKFDIHTSLGRSLIADNDDENQMAAPIEFYFDFSSPYGYFAATRISARSPRSTGGRSCGGRSCSAPSSR